MSHKIELLIQLKENISHNFFTLFKIVDTNMNLKIEESMRNNNSEEMFGNFNADRIDIYSSAIYQTTLLKLKKPHQRNLSNSVVRPINNDSLRNVLA